MAKTNILRHHSPSWDIYLHSGECNLHPLYPPWPLGSPGSPRSSDPFLPWPLCSPNSGPAPTSARSFYPAFLRPSLSGDCLSAFPRLLAALMLPRDCWLPWCFPVPWFFPPSDVHPPRLQSHRRTLAPSLTERTFRSVPLVIYRHLHEARISKIFYASYKWLFIDFRVLRVGKKSVETGLLLTREERDVCPTRLALGERAGYLRRGFGILSPRLGACKLVTKSLRPLSPLAPLILDNKARCVAPTELPLHKGNSESLLHLLSEGSSAVRFSPFWLEQSRCFQLGTWCWTCWGRKRMVQV